MTNLFIDSTTIVGKTFTVSNDVTNTEYTCVGYACNETFLIVGKYTDTVNNRFQLKTFKFGDVKFKP